MARPASPTLTDSELRLMRVLWTRGEATVGDIIDALAAGGTRELPAYNTVLTLLQVMHRKRYVRYRKEGRAFVFSPVVDEQQARRRALRHVLHRFFDDSPALLLNVLRDEPLDAAELDRVRELIGPAPDDAGNPGKRSS